MTCCAWNQRKNSATKAAASKPPTTHASGDTANPRRSGFPVARARAATDGRAGGSETAVLLTGGGISEDRHSGRITTPLRHQFGLPKLASTAGGATSLYRRVAGLRRV